MVANLTIPPNNVNCTFPDARGALLRARKAKSKHPDPYQQATQSGSPRTTSAASTRLFTHG